MSYKTISTSLVGAVESLATIQTAVTFLVEVPLASSQKHTNNPKYYDMHHFIISVIAGCTSFCSLSLGVGKAECILSQNGAGRPARRPARRIAAFNHSHLSALSGGLLLLCGGDW